MIYVLEHGAVVFDEKHLSSEDKKKVRLTLDALPEPETSTTHSPVLRYDAQKNNLYYEYVPKEPIEFPGITSEPPTPEQVQSQILMNTELLIMYKELGL